MGFREKKEVNMNFKKSILNGVLNANRCEEWTFNFHIDKETERNVLLKYSKRMAVLFSREDVKAGNKNKNKKKSFNRRRRQ